MKKWILPVVIGILLMLGNIKNVNATICRYESSAIGEKNGKELTIYTIDKKEVLYSVKNAKTCGSILVCTKKDNKTVYWDDVTNLGNLLSKTQHNLIQEGYSCTFSSGIPEKEECHGNAYKEDLGPTYSAWKTAGQNSENCKDPKTCPPSEYKKYARFYETATKSLQSKIIELNSKYKECEEAIAYFKTVREEIDSKKESVMNATQQYTSASNTLSAEEQKVVEEANKQYDSTNKRIDQIQIEGYHIDVSNVLSCKEVLGNALKYVEMGFNIIQIAAPILLIVLGSVDLAGAVISNDNDALKKATSKLGRRAIAAVAIFFVPMLVKLLIGMTGLDIPDVACGLAYLYKGGIL